MRWMAYMLMVLLVLMVGCAAPGASTDEREADAAAGVDAEAEAEAARRAVEADRAGVVRMIESLPAVGAAQVSVGTGVGGAGAANVSVTVVREDGEAVDDALAQRVVERVLEVFRDMPASNVSVRDGGRPGYLYLGDIGRIE